MKGLKICAVLLAGAFASASAVAQVPTCPAGGSATLGCNSTIVIGPGGTLTIAAGPSGTPYDGSDDNLVGILNNSGGTVTSIGLSGSGNGGGLFAFDGDGIDGYITGSNTTDLSGYGGPLAYFSNISTDLTTGDVNFIGGLADGAATYFSLESSIGSSTITPGPVNGGGGGAVTPEPSTFVLLGTGALSLAGGLRRRFLNK